MSDTPDTLDAVARTEWERLHPLLNAPTMRDLALLESYCAAFSRWRNAEQQLAKTPVLIKTATGAAPNPLLAIAKQAKASMREALADLGLSKAHTATADWCSLEDSRRRLAAIGDVVSHQTLSEYVRKHAEEIPHAPGRGRSGMRIDYAALARHRGENIVVKDRAASTEADPARDARNRERAANASLREFELAHRRGELIPRADVVRAVAGAGVALNQVLQRTRHERAAALKASKDARECMALLIEQDTALQQALADALQALGGAQQDDDDSDAA